MNKFAVNSGASNPFANKFQNPLKSKPIIGSNALGGGGGAGSGSTAPSSSEGVLPKASPI